MMMFWINKEEQFIKEDLQKRFIYINTFKPSSVIKSINNEGLVEWAIAGSVKFSENNYSSDRLKLGIKFINKKWHFKLIEYVVTGVGSSSGGCGGCGGEGSKGNNSTGDTEGADGNV